MGGGEGRDEHSGKSMCRGHQVGVEGRQLLKGSDCAVKGPNKEHLLILLKEKECVLWASTDVWTPHCHHPQ